MRVTFPRLPDHERAYALVERDDGAVYRLYGDRAGRPLPHDLRHLVVERELHIPNGIWGGIAAGLVFDSMQHVSGRRPPHARQRSAELLASLVREGCVPRRWPTWSKAWRPWITRRPPRS